MKATKSIVIGTAGHIDHGKTALVRALTGIDTDRLPEEKRRGITIDLGFASMDVAAPDGSFMRVSFVDAPGHALFIRNMLAGAGCVPAVMLVVAADEGVMQQTREHLAICELLGILDGFTVISKSDLVNESQLEGVRAQIAEFLKDTFLGGVKNAIVPVSAQKGVGLAEVRAELAKLALRAEAAEAARAMRLPLDRTFVKKGFGTVVTGTLLSGQIHAGQTLVLEPGARKVRVRGLQMHGESEDVASSGTRVAVNLSGVETNEISRGQTLVVPGELAPVDLIDAEVTLLKEAPALKHRGRVHLHAFTSEVMAAVSLYGNEPVKPGTTRLMRLKLSTPIVFAPGDRFVVRQSLPAGTIGGGRVLDAHPLLHERKATILAWLEQLAHASPLHCLLLRVRRRGWDGIEIVALAREMGLTVGAIRTLMDTLLTSGEVLRGADDLLLTREAFHEASDLVLMRLDRAGASGLKRSELRSQTELHAEILNAVVDRLAGEGKLRLRGEVVATGGAIAGKADTLKLDAVAAAYQVAGLAAPSVREVAQQLGLPEPEMRRLVTLLLREKRLVRMGDDDAFVHATSLKDLSARLVAMRGKCIDVAAFKALTGLTRKHAIPLLEYLDRERITRKQGDQRLVL